MASNDANMSTADSAQRDIQGAIRMGQQAAQTAKTVTKVAAQAASGNVAGAALTLLKDPATLKKLLKIVLLPIFFLALLMVFFLHALPTLVYEAVVSFFVNLGEQWDQTTYGSGDGVVWSGVLATLNTVGNVIGDTARGIWDGLTSLFSANSGDVDDGADVLSADGMELHVTQDEASQKETLERKITACITKIDKRSAQIYSAINAKRSAIENYFASLYAGTCDEWAGTNIDIQTIGISKGEAIKLLSLYTVMTEASTENLMLSDFMKWLGYYNEFTFATTSFDLGGQGITGSVVAWNGTFMPQYLVEQRMYELGRFGSTQTDFSQYMCAAVDLLLVVDCPDFSTLSPTYTIETRQVPDTDATPDENGEYPLKDIEVTVGSMMVSIAIRSRTADSLANEVAGLWAGALS